MVLPKKITLLCSIVLMFSLAPLGFVTLIVVGTFLLSSLTYLLLVIRFSSIYATKKVFEVFIVILPWTRPCCIANGSSHPVGRSERWRLTVYIVKVFPPVSIALNHSCHVNLFKLGLKIFQAEHCLF